ncbi:ABC transporter ATP-binding protein [Paenibacillus xerothermodurans]|uniref:ABC transporter ATP-binding protein n=1 Tax=Paenibacillus xerothermodurans TaxID=1977292 RepID=UPI0014040323|nr:ATP-binding cassette domain-containing protein [Paenibacillus xerothermodurans]
MNHTPILEIDDLQKTVLENEQRRYLFTNVSAKIEEPTIVALIGASGQGKSTLLRVIGMLDAADHGTIRYRNTLADDYAPRHWRMKVSYVAQQPAMLDGSVDDNLRLVSRLHRQAFDDKLAHKLMEAVGLGAMDRSKRAADLSGGEKQRIALIRTLLLKPEVLLLDEITAALDPQSKEAVEQLLLDWHKREAATMLWVTHDREQARHTSQRVWLMAEHTLQQQADTTRFFENTASGSDGGLAYSNAGEG